MREVRNGSKRVKKNFFFFAFLRVSEHFESIETHFFFFENFREREAQNAREQSERDASAKRKARGSEATE